MNPKFKSFLNNSWTIGICCAVLPLIPITVYWKGLTDFLFKNIEVTIWELILLIILLIVLLITVYRFYYKLNNKNMKINKTAYLEYREDKLGMAHYQWTYIADSSNTYIPFGIKRICSDCKCLVINQKCPVCNKTTIYVGEKSPLELDALIRYNIKIKYGILLT